MNWILYFFDREKILFLGQKIKIKKSNPFLDFSRKMINSSIFSIARKFRSAFEFPCP